MPLRALAITLTLIGLMASPVHAKLFPSRDRNRGRDRDSEERNDDRPSPPEVLEARAKADTSYQQRDYAKVIELTNWLIDNFPTDNVHFAYHLRASAKIELGKVASSAKQVREGISDARAGIAVAGVKYPWLHIPYLYGLTALAEIEHRTDHAEMAIKVVTPVLTYPATKEFTEDDRAQLYYQRGLAYTAKRDFKLAAADFSQAVKLSPQLLGARIKHAESLAALGRSKEALAAYDECVAEFPANLLAYNERGEFKRTTGDLEGAVSDFTRCLAIDSKFAIGYINRGRSLMQLNSPQAAEGDFSEALKLKLDAGTAVLARRLRAVARLGQGDTAAAITDLSAALKASPQDPTLYEERAFAQFFKKDYAAAIADFAKARQLRPQLTYILSWQALAQMRGGQAAEGRALLENALAGKNPPDAWSSKICSYLLDQATEQELLDAAAAGNDHDKSQHLSEAHFFIGQKQLLRDNAALAADHFREAVASQQFSLSAYRGARYEVGDFR